MWRWLVLAAAAAAARPVPARPVPHTLTFNMFVLRPRPGAPERVLLSTDGVSRFGPLLEYLVQRFQGLMSVRLPPDPPDQLRPALSETPDPYKLKPTLPETPDPPDGSVPSVPLGDAAENEVDAAPLPKAPGVVVRPSPDKPGTFEVEINVLVDDGQPDPKKTS